MKTVVVANLGCTLTIKLWAQCDTMTCLGVIKMSGWTTGVLICCFIAALLLLRHDDLLLNALDDSLPFV
jgi:hypothetical protein